MKRSNTPTGTAVAAIAILGISLRIAYVLVFRGLSHDEANTLVFSSCDWLEYQTVVTEGLPPALRKTTMGEWQAYLESEGRICLGSVFRDVVQTDVHPPLYNGFLNLWKAVLGDSVLVARLFNVVVDVSAAFVFFLLARQLLDRSWALVALTFYAIAPAFFGVVGEIRSYALLGFCNLATVWAAHRIIGGRKAWRWWALFGMASVAGVYTHYLFVLLAVPVTVWLFMVLLKRKDRSQLVRGTVTLLVESALLLPLAVSVWRYQIGTATDIGWSGGWLVDKQPLAAMSWTFIDPIIGAFRGLTFSLPGGVSLLLAGALIGTCTYGVMQVRSDDARRLLVTILWVTTVGHVGFYAFGALPTHAIGAKYQVMTVPYILLSLVYVIRSRRIPWMRTAAAVALGGLMLLASSRLVWTEYQNRDHRISAASVARLVPEASLVILDTGAPGMVAPVVESWSRMQPVLVGQQDALIQYGILSNAVEGAESVIYVSTLHFGNSLEGRMQILHELGEVFQGGSGGVAIADSLGTLGCRGCGTGYQIFQLR